MQRGIMAEVRSNSAETRDLLLAILSIQSERQQVVDLQRQGQHIAEQVMAAGQEVVYSDISAVEIYLTGACPITSNYSFSARRTSTAI
jgi:hypothetical protein